MFYADIMKLPQLKELVLLGGAKGIHRPIRWLYFADCMECLENSDNLGDWIHGGELIIVTNISITRNIKKLKQFMYAADKKNAAGFIINVGQISPEIIQVADTLAMPLFELSLSIKLVDLSQIVCKKLIEQENRENALDRFFADLLYTTYESDIEIIYKAQYYGIDLQKPACIAIFRLFNEKGTVDEAEQEEYRTNLQKAIQYEFYNQGSKNLLLLTQNNDIIIRIPLYTLQADIKEVLQHIRNYFARFCKLSFWVGVSDTCDTVEGLKAAVKDAVKTIKISQIMDKKELFYKEMGIYSILTNVENENLLVDYYKDRLGLLIDFDKRQDKNLCDTLETYLECDCNVRKTSSVLFVHRNTLRNRLDKIENILNQKIEGLSFCMELQFAFKVKTYCDMFLL